MFGYVCIYKPEMKVKDYETYKSVYCGLCSALGKDYSFLSRFILNYDCTFFALFALARDGACPGFHSGRCKFNPLKRCTYCSRDLPGLKKAAALNVLLAYYKLIDNIRDSGWIKKTSYSLLRPYFSLMKKKAARLYPEYDKRIYSMTVMQEAAEKAVDCCVDMAAEPTAAMLRDIFSLETEGKLKPAFEQFGYQLGRWIYFMDAVCDIDDDIRRRSFNPIAAMYPDDTEQRREYCEQLVSQSLYLLTQAYELIDIHRFSDILDNIILLGLKNKQKEIIFNGKEKHLHG